MLPPQEQWCHQICVTSACWPKPACSNCTRLLGHETKRYFMSPEQFEQCVKVAAPFIEHSRPDRGLQVNRERPGLKSRKKVIGIFGGEPLMHPKFPELVDILCQYVPQAHRGLWTSYDWVKGKSPVWGDYLPQVSRLLGKMPNGNVFDTQSGNGYVNWNMHEEHQACSHQPVLVASAEVEPDEKTRWDLINKCWVQQEWSAAYALDFNDEPKFYFCEVASSFDRVFRLGTGLSVEPGVWSHHLWFEPDAEGVMRPQGPYAKQILSTCNRCGSALKLPGRRDREFRDDISPDNLLQLRLLGSPMVERGQFQVTSAADYAPKEGPHAPYEYLKDGRAQQHANFAAAAAAINPGGK